MCTKSTEKITSILIKKYVRPTHGILSLASFIILSSLPAIFDHPH